MSLSHQIATNNASRYLANGRLRFFDFARHVAFGFVAEERGGYYAEIQLNGSETVEIQCGCKVAHRDHYCVHAAVLERKALGWPREQRSPTWKRFDDHRVTALLKNVPPSDLKLTELIEQNSRMLTQLGVSERWLQYLGGSDTALAKRDRRAWYQARVKARNDAEKKMALKGFPSALMRFEESELYLFAKLMVELEERHALEVKITADSHHQVTIAMSVCGEPVVQWSLPAKEFIRGMRKHLGAWVQELKFPVQTTSFPTVYAIRFVEDGSLSIDPHVQVGDETFEPIHQSAISHSLHYHPQVGYFFVQSGLSPFELNYSSPGPHRVNKDQVDRWLKEHQTDLETLDRSMIDSIIFDEAIIDSFDELEVTTTATGDSQWSVTLEARYGEFRMDHATLCRTAVDKSPYVRFAGRLLRTEFGDIAMLRSFLQGIEAVTLKADQIARLQASFMDRIKWLASDEDQALAELIAGKTVAVASLSGSRLQLRDYQQIGYEWLCFLKKYGLGGLLCDQMGLGKTHQAMALLHATHSAGQARSLIVCPTSVLHHWCDRLSDFCPELRVGLFHGSQRSVENDLSQDVIVTSYGVLRSSLEILVQPHYDLFVLDEIQQVKNTHTQAHRAVQQIRSGCRIGLTGTPIENRLDELKALFDIVFPDLLGDSSGFRKSIADPIRKYGSPRARQLLRSLIGPFTLRRAKSEVLTELPPKQETVLHLELSPLERELYEQIRREGLQVDEGSGASFLHVFQLIGQLKQFCNHPGLLLSNDEGAKLPCAKWDAFCEVLEDSLACGKVVVFSQYLRMIDWIKRHLDHHGIDYACVTGSTSDRTQQIKRFQEDDDCRVFVGSLNASGVGIDLTAAATVIHYDRWWNAAREEQATDRVHRIGQAQPVQVFKFTIKSTIEERIHALIEKKRKLLEDVVEFDSATAQKALTLSELMEILQ